MAYAIQWVRSLIYVITVYVTIAVVGLALFPWALVSRRGARVACMSVCRFVRWVAPVMIGLKTEVRGTPPDYECLVAATADDADMLFHLQRCVLDRVGTGQDVNDVGILRAGIRNGCERFAQVVELGSTLRDRDHVFRFLRYGDDQELGCGRRGHEHRCDDR